MNRSSVRKIFDDYPDLGQFGFGTQPPAIDENFLTQVATARRWFAGASGRSRLVERRGSYAVKHLVEQACNTYITNGAAIAAAVLEGFTPVRGKYQGPNCRFQRAP
jgi:hypothetical protein